jgi:hypothetical protein
MQAADTLVRRTLIQSSPDYAQQRIHELWNVWALDIAKRPGVYEAAIDRAAAKYQPVMRQVLPLTIRQVRSSDPTEREQLEAQAKGLLADYQVQDETALWRIWMDTFFVPGSELDDEFAECCLALDKAGRIGKL